MRQWLLLKPAERFSDAGLLVARLACGSFLIYQSHDNVFSASRMAEFQAFLESLGFWQARLAAHVSVYAQFVAGIGFMIGASTRWLALITVVNFVVALAMVHLGQDVPLVWPALALVALAAVFGTVGAGRYSVDFLIEFRFWQTKRGAEATQGPSAAR